jgi:SpoVK/Ycf46/Vps4 family AAA+-type ATPase
MKEAMQEDFRQWYMEHKRSNGVFPEFPEEEIWRQPGFKFGAVDSIVKTVAEVVPMKDDKLELAKKGVEKKADKKGAKDEVLEEDTPSQLKIDDSIFIEEMKKEQLAYTTKWQKKDESDNFAQKHEQEIIKTDKRHEVEIEIKKEVFEILQDELKNLKLAVENEKGKKSKGAKAGKGKGKKDKKDKGKKGKKEKDPTANRTIESLVEELVQTGILQKFTPSPLSSFLGEFDTMGTSLSRETFILPSLSELSKTLVEFCVLPNGFPESASKIPKISTILLYGPPRTGKAHLVKSLATELGAQIFNLSPKNTAGQYSGKANVSKMLHITFKVARAQAPAIIYIDGLLGI